MIEAFLIDNSLSGTWYYNAVNRRYLVTPSPGHKNKVYLCLEENKLALESGEEPSFVQVKFQLVNIRT